MKLIKSMDDKIKWFDAIICALGCNCCEHGNGMSLVETIFLSEFNRKFNESFNSLDDAYTHTFGDEDSSAYEFMRGTALLDLGND